MNRAPSQPQNWAAWLQALREPALTLDWSMVEWERVVRLSRRLRLLARLAERVTTAGLLEKLPAEVQKHPEVVQAYLGTAQ